MAHLTARSAYESLAERLNRFPQGAPPSELLYSILAMLFTEREAGLVSRLPIKPFTAARADRIWKLGPARTRRVLEELAGRGILIDMHIRSETFYVLPPPMAGFFEFSLMRVRSDVDQKVLSELFYQYLNVEEDFIKELFGTGQTQLGRVFVSEPVLSGDDSLHVMDYERASRVIDTARHIGVGICYCRHKMQHVERACSAPMENCLTFGNTARSLTRHGIAREIKREEAMDLLGEAVDQDLVQFGENVRDKVSFICNCCGCCCEAMIAARRFGILKPVHTTNFLPVVDDGACSGCGRCAGICPIEAVSLVRLHEDRPDAGARARVDTELCLGCGVCVKNCGPGAMSLAPRARRIVTPLTTTRRTVLMAVERGRLQDLIFDNRALLSHRAMAAVLGAILRLPPVKRALAAEQVRSRYLRWAEGERN